MNHQDFFAPLSQKLGDDLEFVFRAHADHAVDDVRALSPVAVFMDYSMGSAHLSGAQAVANLRAHFDSAALPIVGISSDGIANDRMRLAGADYGVVKVAAPARLATVLPQLLRSTGSG